MKSLYAQYVKERENVETIESDTYFATYKVTGNEIYIKDIYVIEKCRDNKIASQVADEIAEIGKNQGCKYLIGSVCPSGAGADISLRVLMNYGMRLLRSADNIIYFVKEI